MPSKDPRKHVHRLKQVRFFDRFTRDRERIPPGQFVTRKFPVLTYGEAPEIAPEAWRLEVFGAVEQPLVLDWPGLLALPRKTIRVDIHCVTRWSIMGTEWEGVPFQAIVERVQPLPNARFVMQHAYGGYTTNVPLDDLLREEVLLAYRLEGQPIPIPHGGPVRMLVPHLYFWKSAKWIKGLEFMTEDRPGFWEQHGYHMHGDPWKEERFSGD